MGMSDARPSPLAPRPVVWIRRFPYSALLLLVMVFHLPGLATLPPLDRDEARYAQASAQMLERRDFIDIRFQDQPRYKKPVGIYWLQSAAVAVLSRVEDRAIWPYRVPSLLGALLAVWLCFWGGRRLFDDLTALWGAALLCAALVLVAESTIAKTDAALLATITAMQMALGRIYCDSRQGHQAPHFAPPGPLALLFWAAMGLGILIKGPIAPLVAALTVGALALADRRGAWLRRLNVLPGLVIVAVITLPWAAAMWQLSEGAFFTRAATGDIAPKLVSGQESHWAPPLTFAALSPLLFWPGALFLPPALVAAWRNRTKPAIRFCLAWAGPAWLLFELVPTKLPHYVLPTFPALALLCAVFLTTAPRHEGCLRLRGLSGLSALLWGGVTLGLAAALIGLPLRFGDGLSGVRGALILLFALAALGAGFWTLRLWWQSSRTAAAASALVTGAVITVALMNLVLPALSQLTVSPRLAAAIERVSQSAAARPAVIAIAGYAEPSIVFLLGSETKLVTAPMAADILAEHNDALIVIEQRLERTFRASLAARHLAVTPLATVHGLNYSRGQTVALTLYQAAP